MAGTCGLFSSKRSRRNRTKERPVMGIVDYADVSHEGITTVEANNGSDLSSRSYDLCICIVTWNMNGQVLRSEDIQRLVGKERKYDILVIGLQEVPRFNVLEVLENTLVESHMLLGKSVMQSLQMYIFGLKNLNLCKGAIKIDKQSTGGFGGLIRRKKGAVAIRLSYKGIDMVFISCHLSAHARNVEDRNSEFRRISRSLFSNHNYYANDNASKVTVWLGDLNYRLRGINTSPARNLIQENQHDLLTSKDQLLQEAERGQVFNGYREGTLAFKPTYKYDVGTSDYDTSHKERVPAWTDRILYRIEGKEINGSLELYDSIDEIYSSDHKPVKALLCLKINVEYNQKPVKRLYYRI